MDNKNSEVGGGGGETEAKKSGMDAIQKLAEKKHAHQTNHKEIHAWQKLQSPVIYFSKREFKMPTMNNAGSDYG